MIMFVDVEARDDHIDLQLVTRTISTAVVVTFIFRTFIKVGPWLLILTADFAFLLAQTCGNFHRK